MKAEIKQSITYKIVKNEKYGDYRIDELIGGEWNNQFDNNWSKKQAEQKLASINGTGCAQSLN